MNAVIAVLLGVAFLALIAGVIVLAVRGLGRDAQQRRAQARIHAQYPNAQRRVPDAAPLAR